MKYTLKFICCLWMTLLSILYCKAQDPIDPDRPDQSENVHILKPREVQIETGVLVNTFQQRSSSWIGSGLIRYGLLKKVEVRLLLEDGRASRRYFEESSQGRYPISFSTKLGVLEKHAWLPDMTLLGYLNLPFLTPVARDTRVVPSVIVALEKKLRKLTFETNGGINWDAFNSGHNYQASTSLSFDISGKWKVFGEYYGQYETGEGPKHNADGGILVLLSNDLTFDLAGGGPIFSSAHDPFATIGVSFRVK